MGITANTVEGLERRIAQQSEGKPEFIAPDIYLEMSAAEWVHMNGHWEVLSTVTDILSAYGERLYAETGFDDLDKALNYDQIWSLTSEKIDNIIVGVLQRLRQEGIFSSNSFVDDVFLGVQYGDIGDPEMAVIEKFSNQLNSQHWANKLAEVKAWMKSTE